MSPQHDLLGWELEHVRRSDAGHRVATRGRCVGAWGADGVLTLALRLEDDQLVTVVHQPWDDLRVVGARRVVPG